MSIEMDMSIEGLPELRAKLERLDASMIENVHYAMAFEGEPIKRTAEALCPVRTGYLRSTIWVRVVGWLLKLGASAHYARHVELGTRFMKAVRFLSRALELRMQALINAVNRAIDQAIREASR